MPRLSTTILAGLLALAGCSDGDFHGTPTTPEPPMPVPEPPTPNPNPRVHTVRVLDDSFEPEILQIKPGDSVRWVLEANEGHWVTEPDMHSFRAYLAERGDSLVYHFSGSFGDYIAYFWCDEHNQTGMVGCVRVGAGAPECTYLTAAGTAGHR